MCVCVCEHVCMTLSVCASVPACVCVCSCAWACNSLPLKYVIISASTHLMQ